MFDYDRKQSAYVHVCAILPEKDVLEIDIPGTGRCTRFRRWWHDLFLLSYNCDRSKGFYTSSNSLRDERFRQFRKYRHRIHPLSKFSNFWNFQILQVLLTNKILFRYTSTFLYDKLPMWLYYFGAVLELIIIIDLYVSLKTGYINSEARKIFLDTKTCLKIFCTKKLFLHVTAAMPMHWFMFLRYGHNIDCGLCKCNRYVCALKIISVFSTIRIIEASAYWRRRRYPQIQTWFYKFLRIGTCAFITMLQLYDLSEVTCLLIFMSYGKVEKSSYLAVMAGLRYSNNNYENFSFLGYDIGRMMQSVFHYSFAFTLEVFHLDRLTALLAYLVSCMYYGWSLMECYALIYAIVLSNAQRIRIKQKAMNFLECNQVSNSWGDKVSKYFNYRSSMIKITEARNTLYKLLPDILKDEIKLNSYLNIVKRIPLFTGWPTPVLEDLVGLLQRKVYLENDYVALANVQGEGLMIVHNGVLAVYSENQKEIGHLIDGDFFGALSLVTDKEKCMSYVVAVTNCTILLLSKGDFRRYMKKHPQLFYGFTLDVKARSRHSTTRTANQDKEPT